MQQNRTPHPAPTARAVPELDVADYLPRRTATSQTPAAARPTPSAATLALAAAFDRLERTLVAESEALERNEPLDFADVNRQKSQSLLEITRLSRALPPGQGTEITARLAPIRDRLAANQRLLGFHLEAVRELSDIMVGILSDAESDGTYDHTAVRRGAAA
jgi:hypothetical protein